MKQITECYRCFVKLFVCYRVTTAAQIQCLEQVFFFCVVLFAWPSMVNFQVLLCMTLSCSLNLSSMITSSLVFSNIAYCFSFLFVRTIQQYGIFYIQFSGMNFQSIRLVYRLICAVPQLNIIRFRVMPFKKYGLIQISHHVIVFLTAVLMLNTSVSDRFRSVHNAKSSFPILNCWTFF